MNSFGNALKIALINWRTMIKSVFIQLLVFAIVVALCLWAFNGLFVSISALIEDIDFDGAVTTMFEEITSGTLSSRQLIDNVVAIVERVVEAVNEVPNFIGRINLSYLLAIGILCVYRMTIGCCDVSVMCQVTEFMTSNSFRPFSWYFFKKIVLSIKFLFWQFLIATAFDLLVICSGMGLYVVMLPIFHSAALIIALILTVALYVARQALFAFWLPVIIADSQKKPLKALNTALCKIPNRFWNVFWKYLVAIAVSLSCWLGIIALRLYCGISSYWMFISTAMTFFSFYVIKCIAVTEYFEDSKRQYFTVRIKLPKSSEVNAEKH